MFWLIDAEARLAHGDRVWKRERIGDRFDGMWGTTAEEIKLIRAEVKDTRKRDRKQFICEKYDHHGETRGDIDMEERLYATIWKWDHELDFLRPDIKYRTHDPWGYGGAARSWAINLAARDPELALEEGVWSGAFYGPVHKGKFTHTHMRYETGRLVKEDVDVVTRLRARFLGIQRAHEVSVVFDEMTNEIWGGGLCSNAANIPEVEELAKDYEEMIEWRPNSITGDWTRAQDGAATSDLVVPERWEGRASVLRFARPELLPPRTMVVEGGAAGGDDDDVPLAHAPQGGDDDEELLPHAQLDSPELLPLAAQADDAEEFLPPITHEHEKQMDWLQHRDEGGSVGPVGTSAEQLDEAGGGGDALLSPPQTRQERFDEIQESNEAVMQPLLLKAQKQREKRGKRPNRIIDA